MLSLAFRLLSRLLRLHPGEHHVLTLTLKSGAPASADIGDRFGPSRVICVYVPVVLRVLHLIWLIILPITGTIAYAKKTGAIASVGRRRREPDRAISPE